MTDSTDQNVWPYPSYQGLTVIYHDGLGSISIRYDQTNELLATWTQCPSLGDMADFVERTAYGLTTDQIIIVLNTASCVDELIEHAAHDIRQYGQIGVTY